MGLLDEITSLASQATGGQAGGAAGGLMQAIEQHPGGIQGVIDHFKQNGMGEHVNNWSSGQQTTATPGQVEQGLGGTGLIEAAAAKTGLSPQMVTMAMSTVLPMVLAHYSQSGGTAQPSAMSGMVSQVLGRFL